MKKMGVLKESKEKIGLAKRDPLKIRDERWLINLTYCLWTCKSHHISELVFSMCIMQFKLILILNCHGERWQLLVQSMTNLEGKWWAAACSWQGMSGTGPRLPQQGVPGESAAQPGLKTRNLKKIRKLEENTNWTFVSAMGVNRFKKLIPILRMGRGIGEFMSSVKWVSNKWRQKTWSNNKWCRS